MKGAEGLRLAGLASTDCTVKSRLHDRLNRQFCFGLIGQIKFIKALAAQTGQPRVKLLTPRGAETGADRPIFARVESLNLHLAVNNQPQADRLHPACRFRPRQATPKHGRELEPHKVIQGAAGQIGLDQFHVHLAGIFHRFGDGGLGDGVEHNARYGRIFFDRAALCERLLQMPADRFALAVRVGCEDQLIVVFQRIGDGLDVFFAGSRQPPKASQIHSRDLPIHLWEADRVRDRKRQER